MATEADAGEKKKTSVPDFRTPHPEPTRKPPRKKISVKPKAADFDGLQKLLAHFNNRKP